MDTFYIIFCQIELILTYFWQIWLILTYFLTNMTYYWQIWLILTYFWQIWLILTYFWQILLISSYFLTNITNFDLFLTRTILSWNTWLVSVGCNLILLQFVLTCLRFTLFASDVAVLLLRFLPHETSVLDILATMRSR